MAWRKWGEVSPTFLKIRWIRTKEREEKRENEKGNKKKENEKEMRIRANKRKEFGWIRKERKEGERKEERTSRRERERERERERGKKGFRFSLGPTEIEPSIFIGARGKVDPRNESYVWVPKLGSFVKLQEVENFPNLIIFSLKAI